MEDYIEKNSTSTSTGPSSAGLRVDAKPFDPLAAVVGGPPIVSYEDKKQKTTSSATAADDEPVFTHRVMRHQDPVYQMSKAHLEMQVGFRVGTRSSNLLPGYHPGNHFYHHQHHQHSNQQLSFPQPNSALAHLALMVNKLQPAENLVPPPPPPQAPMPSARRDAGVIEPVTFRRHDEGPTRHRGGVPSPPGLRADGDGNVLFGDWQIAGVGADRRPQLPQTGGAPFVSPQPPSHDDERSGGDDSATPLLPLTISVVPTLVQNSRTSSIPGGGQQVAPKPFVPSAMAKPWTPPGVVPGSPATSSPGMSQGTTPEVAAPPPPDSARPPRGVASHHDDSDSDDDDAFRPAGGNETLRVDMTSFFSKEEAIAPVHEVQTKLQSLQGVKANMPSVPVTRWAPVTFLGAQVFLPAPFLPQGGKQHLPEEERPHYVVSVPSTHPNVKLALVYYKCFKCVPAVFPGRLTSRPPDLKLGGICGDVPALCIAHLIKIVTNVDVVAVDMFGHTVGRCNLWVKDQTDAKILLKLLDKSIWMSPIPYGYAVVAPNEQAKEYLLWYLEGLRNHGPRSARFPRHLTTCERWIV
jgi:hypothetical protein